MRRTLHSLLGAAALLFSLTASGPAHATIISILSMSVPNVVLDFDLMAAGPTSVGAVNAAFPGAGLLNLSFTQVLTGTGVNTTYNENLAGRALAPDVATGGIQVVNEGASFAGEANELTIQVDRLITQMGFAISDRPSTNATNDISFYDGVTLVGTYDNLFVQDGIAHFLLSSVPFDRIVIGEADDWVVPLIALEVAGEVPEPDTGLLMIGGLMGLAFFGRRRSRT